MAVENMTLAPFMANNRNPYNYAKVEQVARDLTTGWLTLDEITQQLNLFQDESQDAYLESLELATRMAIEDYLGMPIFPVTYKVYYPYFAFSNNALYLDLPEVTEGQGNLVVESVEVYGTSNTTPVLITETAYAYDPTGNRIILAEVPNEINQYIANPIVVTYSVSPSIIAQYPVIKQAGLMLLTHLYNNRSTVGDTVGMKSEIPFGVSTLLRPYKPLVM
jgi:hypothetical protein